MAETKPLKETKNKKSKSTTKDEGKTKISPKEKPTKSNKGLIIGLSAIATAAIIGIIFAILSLGKVDPADPKASLDYSDAFFIYDDAKYTLWNADGKRINEEDYSYGSLFIAGHALVKKGEQVGIIDQNGRMSVDFGKYSDISLYGGLFKAQDGNTKELSLITGDGRTLVRANEMDVNSDTIASGFALIKTEDEFYVYTHGGVLIAKASVDPSVEEPSIDSRSDFGAFCYKNTNTIFDARDGRTVAKFEDECYSIDEVTEDRTKLFLESNSSDNKNYKLLANGKIYDLNEMDYYSFTVLGDLIGYNEDYEIALLDENYKVMQKVNPDLELKDYQNYTTINDDGEAEIYYQGKKVKTFSNEASIPSGVMYEDYYAVKDDGKARFYHLDGSVAFDQEFYEIRTIFNKHHHAIVADEEEKYYLINANGKRVNNEIAKQIFTQEGGYLFKNEDGKYAVANKEGQLITDYKYTSNTYYRNTVVGHNIWSCQIESKKYDVIDADNNKVLLEDVNIGSFSTNYFTVKNAEDKTEYYTYSGKLFYTSEK